MVPTLVFVVGAWGVSETVSGARRGRGTTYHVLRMSGSMSKRRAG